jgi:hypothetical protein
MATPIQPKYNGTPGSSGGPSAAGLVLGEIASNVDTAKLFLKLRDGTVAEFSTGGGGGGGAVTSVAGRTGAITLTTADIGGLTSTFVSNSGGISSIKALTQAQYNALGTPDQSTLYIITA